MTTRHRYTTYRPTEDHRRDVAQGALDGVGLSRIEVVDTAQRLRMFDTVQPLKKKNGRPAKRMKGDIKCH